MRTTPVTIAILLLLVVGIGIYYANRNLNTDVNTADNTSPTSTVETSTPTATATSSPAATNNVSVDIRNFAYSPASLTVKRGTSVTWTNSDTAPHTVTSVTGDLLDSPSLSNGESFSFTFTETGTVNYYCTIHPNMKATVVVTE